MSGLKVCNGSNRSCLRALREHKRTSLEGCIPPRAENSLPRKINTARLWLKMVRRSLLQKILSPRTFSFNSERQAGKTLNGFGTTTWMSSGTSTEGRSTGMSRIWISPPLLSTILVPHVLNLSPSVKYEFLITIFSIGPGINLWGVQSELG